MLPNALELLLLLLLLLLLQLLLTRVRVRRESCCVFDSVTVDNYAAHHERVREMSVGVVSAAFQKSSGILVAPSCSLPFARGSCVPLWPSASRVA